MLALVAQTLATPLSCSTGVPMLYNQDGYVTLAELYVFHFFRSKLCGIVWTKELHCAFLSRPFTPVESILVAKVSIGGPM